MFGCSAFSLPAAASMLGDTPSAQFWGAAIMFFLYGTVVMVIVGTGLLTACAIVYRIWRNMVIKDFSHKCVFITGTDKGFGRDLALELDRRGLVVYAGCHSETGAENLRNQASRRLKALVIEVTDRESVMKTREFIENDLPPGKGLWAIVNNAGITRGIIFDFAQVEDYRDVFEVNFFGVLGVTEVFLPLIKKAGGRIVNVVSIMGRCSLAAGPYSSSKFALEAYSDGLRRAMKAFGVCVSIIEPGFFHTNMTDPNFWETEFERLWKKLPLGLQEDYGVEFKEKAKKVLGKFIFGPPLSSFNNLTMVTNDIIHAIGARHPKSRYVIGLDALLIYQPASFLPDWVLDFFMCSILPYNKVAEYNNNKIK